MRIPLQITFRDMAHSDAIEQAVRERAGRLDRYHPNITGCRVTVEMEGRHKHQGNLFNVRVDVTVPGGELMADRNPHEDVYVSIRDTFDAMRRMVEDNARRQRGEVKTHAEAARGIVVRMFPEEGYGFIRAADGRELYFSRENVVSPDFDQLDPGAEVQFLEEMGAEGLQAKRVSAGRHHVPG